MKVVYIDVLFLVNLIPDYLILRLCGLIFGVSFKQYRLISGAVFGAFSAVLLYFTDLSSELALIAKCAVCLLSCLISFGKKRLFALCTLLCAISFAFAGACEALSFLGITVSNTSIYADISPIFLFVSCVFAYCVLRLVFGRNTATQKTVRLRIFYRGRSIEINALCDTGNALRDPFSNKTVAVCGIESAHELFSEEVFAVLSAFANAIDALNALPESVRRDFMLIPYTSVGASSLLLVLKPQKAEKDGKETDILLGLSPADIRPGLSASAVIGV